MPVGARHLKILQPHIIQLHHLPNKSHLPAFHQSCSLHNCPSFSTIENNSQPPLLSPASVLRDVSISSFLSTTTYKEEKADRRNVKPSVPRRKASRFHRNVRPLKLSEHKHWHSQLHFVCISLFFFISPKSSYSFRFGWPKSRNSGPRIQHQLWRPCHSTARHAITMGRTIVAFNLRGDGTPTGRKDVEARHRPTRCLFRGSSMARQKLEATTWARNPDCQGRRHPLHILSTFK